MVEAAPLPPPRLVSITPTSHCNLRCVMCNHGYSEVERKEFNSDLLHKLGELCLTAGILDLTGVGEPLMSKFFWDILERTPIRAGVEPQLMFNTNGTLLTDKNVDRILCSNARRIRISIDAASPKMFFNIRGTKLRPILDGVKRLITHRNKLGRKYPEIGIEMTIMKYNLRQVKRMIKLSKRLGADFFEGWSLNAMPHEMADKIGVIFHGMRKPSFWRRLFRTNPIFAYREQMLSNIASSQINDLLKRWVSYAKHYDMSSAFIIAGYGSPVYKYKSDGDCEKIKDSIDWQKNSIRCPLPWFQLRSDYDGNITACCWGPVKLGTLKQQTWREIWEGEVMGGMRADLIAGCVPAVCRGAACPYLAEENANADK